LKCARGAKSNVKHMARCVKALCIFDQDIGRGKGGSAYRHDQSVRDGYAAAWAVEDVDLLVEVSEAVVVKRSAQVERAERDGTDTAASRVHAGDAGNIVRKVKIERVGVEEGIARGRRQRDCAAGSAAAGKVQ